jgi:hypothetical protein
LLNGDVGLKYLAGRLSQLLASIRAYVLIELVEADVAVIAGTPTTRLHKRTQFVGDPGRSLSGPIYF